MTDQPPAPGDPTGDYASRRTDYASAGLLEIALAVHPLAQFESWYAEAVGSGEPEPNAMTLATVGADHSPSIRNVLLKQVDPRGFVFYTNYASRKAVQIGAGGPVALAFRWSRLHRQVCVRGRAERVPVDETADYFRQRPWASRISAWASHQSATVADRATLDAGWARLAERWPDRGSPEDVPVPGHWGGFVTRAVEIEFWQGRQSRLHDRLVFLTQTAAEPPALDDPGGWRLERRQP